MKTLKEQTQKYESDAEKIREINKELFPKQSTKEEIEKFCDQFKSDFTPDRYFKIESNIDASIRSGVLRLTGEWGNYAGHGKKNVEDAERYYL